LQSVDGVDGGGVDGVDGAVWTVWLFTAAKLKVGNGEIQLERPGQRPCLDGGGEGVLIWPRLISISSGLIFIYINGPKFIRLQKVIQIVNPCTR
jgi:hypothetical protein